VGGCVYRAWPLLHRAAGLYRCTLLRRTQVIAVVGSCGKSTTVRTTQTGLGVPRAEKLPVNTFSGLALALLKVRRGDRCPVRARADARPLASGGPFVRRDLDPRRLEVG